MSGRDRPHGRHVPPAAVSRYDLVLAVIPSAFIVTLLVGSVLSVPARTALLAAAGVGALALADALFLNPPRRGGTGGRAG